MTGVAIPPAARALLDRCGYAGPATATQLAGGANNRVFRIDTAAAPLALKEYFAHPGDRWDRQRAEWTFATFAWERGIRCLPEPIACDPGNRLALYAYVDGVPFKPGEIGAGEIDAALAFVASLEAERDAAATIGTAAEACFTIADHLATIDRRVADLQRVADAQALAFVRDELVPAWASVRAGIASRGGAQPPAAACRCLSPSDFGFHNALRRPDGTICFLDFEYAGWDDPAKLVGDFFNQVAVPVPKEFFGRFARGVARALGDTSEAIAERARLLMPAYAVKWCCIVLNDFRPVGAARRRYAGALSAERKTEQLQKARALLAGPIAASPSF